MPWNNMLRSEQPFAQLPGCLGNCRLVQILAKRLRTGVVFRRADVDEHSALLESVNAALQQIGEYIFLKAGWAVWNPL